MPSDVRHFLGLFRVELDDLLEDVKHLRERWAKRFENGDTTNYVYKENEIILHQEYEAILKFMEIVDGIDPSSYKYTTELQEDILAKARDHISRLQEPEAVYILLKRKIEKVHRYLSLDEESSGSQ